MFQTQRARQLSPSFFLLSIALHAAGLLLLYLARFPAAPPRVRLFQSVLLAPRPERIAVAIPQPVPAPRRFIAPPPRAADPAPKLILPAPAPPPPPLPESRPLPKPVPISAPPLPPPISIGAFEEAKLLPPQTVRQPQPKSAGFVGVTGISSNPRPRSLLVTGGFGTAQPAVDAHAARTLAAASGFGDAQSAASPGPPPSAHVSSAGFGDVSAASTSRSARISAAIPDTVPAEILDKPRPAYTGEALRLNIEGEVLLEVVFEASGSLRVLRVIHGLGHGLDENAIAAARGIRFRPAQRGGSAVDSPAVVHITFQLAY